ncbi:hypothetical protein K470DRAFT_9634 [Piedraia hortae CBS 480.64]|uniref:Uncharacterized protein n=1 Tax=Piedraia hortae CBS 480.64 TaxID=1314780 RepID=A0A6A7C6S0_9PEZI|nr:hypothetical protein K470DRAFT_9634 [Piedraia hortae CBS 480.64]
MLMVSFAFTVAGLLSLAFSIHVFINNAKGRKDTMTSIELMETRLENTLELQATTLESPSTIDGGGGPEKECEPRPRQQRRISMYKSCQKNVAPTHDQSLSQKPEFLGVFTSIEEVSPETGHRLVHA